MAKKGNREIIHLKSSESAYMYTTKKNKKQTPGRLKLNKFDPIVRKHVEFVEKK